MTWRNVLDDFVPSRADALALKKLITTITKKIKVKDTKVIVGGSGGKNTWLKGTHDVDLYVKFNYSKFKDKSDQLSAILHKSLKKQFRRVISLHGSRDYFQIVHAGFTFEIVPILDIKNYKQARNTTDLSQLHVNFVKKYPKLVNEIRLAKLFAKATNTYGAESYLRGFSGYALEVLTIQFGSFLKFIKAVSKWKASHIIGKKKDVALLNASKKMSPLILIDPVQPDRNVAAALSQEKYDLFKSAAKKFVKNPSLKSFTKKSFDLKKLAKKGKVFFFTLTPLSGKRDIVGAKMLKAFEFLQKQLTLHDFNLLASNWEFDEKKSFMYFVLDSKPLTKTFKHYGPPKDAVKSLKQFKKKYKTIAFEGKKSYTKKQRLFTTLEPLFEQLLCQKNIKERVRTIQITAVIDKN
tara:strand:- start:2602 stop:3825 length:1224 start_codon:yes stop_codon:yes gene_type:complete